MIIVLIHDDFFLIHSSIYEDGLALKKNEGVDTVKVKEEHRATSLTCTQAFTKKRTQTTQ
jgi:hypothetical protein